MKKPNERTVAHAVMAMCVAFFLLVALAVLGAAFYWAGWWVGLIVGLAIVATAAVFGIEWAHGVLIRTERYDD